MASPAQAPQPQPEIRVSGAFTWGAVIVLFVQLVSAAYFYGELTNKVENLQQRMGTMEYDIRALRGSK